MTNNNPFTYGNPISDPRRFFGREHEIELIFSRLRNAEFESSSLVGERRIGKTSLLNYLADRDVRRRYDLLPGTHMFVYVDLQMMNLGVTQVRLWQRLLRQMGRVCQDSTVHQAIDEIRQQDAIDNFALADLFDIVDEKNQYVVFLLDEFEKVTENPNFDTDFFYGLRSLAIQHHLALVTSSRRELIELCHSDAIRSSPFFNIFANINLGLFTENEARDLIDTSLAGTGVEFSEDIVQMIFRVAGFHPYFLQVACYNAFESYAAPVRWNAPRSLPGSSIKRPARTWPITGTLLMSMKRLC
jgi:serine/threonine-protein kinase